MYLIVAIPLSLLALVLVVAPIKNKYFLAPYLFFFLGPLLTYFGVIGVLTGFDGEKFYGNYTFGITFYTVYIAYQISRYKKLIKEHPLKFVLSVVNPFYLFTGPIPTKSTINNKFLDIKRIVKLFKIVNSDLILGIFLSAILAPSLTPYFYLKNSTNIIDIFLFGFIFEIFVYLNFAGYSMVAWALMRLVGVKAQRNFRQPFGAVSIIDYWQRWHISLSVILKELFFTKARPLLGLYFSVLVVFLASALWHGISINFVLWGAFHSFLWCLTYYLIKIKYAKFNYLLLIFGVVVGRVIFSELNWSLLSIKLLTIFDYGRWSNDSQFIFLTLTLREKINSLFVILVILGEVVAPRLGFKDRDYKYLKSPFVSALISIYICLAFVGFHEAPLYGNR